MAKQPIEQRRERARRLKEWNRLQGLTLAEQQRRAAAVQEWSRLDPQSRPPFGRWYAAREES